jgi:hypothetical protein
MTELTPPLVLPAEQALVLLAEGALSIEGRVTTASNATLYCRVELDGVAAACVYKPVSGERPLWDYPDGTLAEREYATYLVGAATGWEPIPPTVLREGPMGVGMVQLWISEDEDYDMIAAVNSGEVPALARMAVLDAVVNNSDRKVSHLIPTAPAEAAPGRPAGEDERRVYGVDHGVSFGVEDKLRTVLWQWAGAAFDAEHLEVLTHLSEQLDGRLGEELGRLLTRREVRATRRRVLKLLTSGEFPLPPTDWPAVPYPPY